jgi:hypothetical protein
MRLTLIPAGAQALGFPDGCAQREDIADDANTVPPRGRKRNIRDRTPPIHFLIAPLQELLMGRCAIAGRSLAGLTNQLAMFAD